MSPLYPGSRRIVTSRLPIWPGAQCMLGTSYSIQYYSCQYFSLCIVPIKCSYSLHIIKTNLKSREANTNHITTSLLMALSCALSLFHFLLGLCGHGGLAERLYISVAWWVLIPIPCPVAREVCHMPPYYNSRGSSHQNLDALHHPGYFYDCVPRTRHINWFLNSSWKKTSFKSACVVWHSEATGLWKSFLRLRDVAEQIRPCWTWWIAH